MMFLLRIHCRSPVTGFPPFPGIFLCPGAPFIKSPPDGETHYKQLLKRAPGLP